MTGTTIGKYRVLDRLGRGGMGTVYRAVDETLHRDVAIKVLNAELNDPEVARRFRAEAITVARLSHPGIATIYELFEHDGQWLMVMEFVRGETLESMVTRMGPLSPQHAAEVCMQALAALVHAHAMGVVHRDLKPANLMVTEGGVVKVMDFGIARVSGGEHLTTAGFMMGTPAYMAPEQVKGGDIDARADLYAMGVVFYRLTTAVLPFKGATPFAMAQSQVSDPPTPVALVRTDLPAWVGEIVERALAKDPEHRFQSAAAFHEAFARCLAGLTLPSGLTPHGGYPSLTPHGGLPMLTPSRPMPSVAYSLPPVPPPSGATARSGSSESLTTVAALGTGPVVGPSDPTVAALSGSLAAANAPAPPALPVSQGASGAKRAVPMMWIGAAGALVLVAAFAAYMFRGGTAPGDAPATPAASTAVESPLAPPPAASPVVTTPAGSPPSTNPSARKPVPAPSPASAAAAADVRPSPPATDALITFGDVKLYEVSGKRAADKDVVLNFAGGHLLLMPKSGGAAMATLPYQRMTSATYVRARDPKWDKSLAAPPDDLDVGSFIRTPRHWLVLQGRDYFEILRLEDSNFAKIIETIETRTGLKVQRPQTN